MNTNFMNANLELSKKIIFNHKSKNNDVRHLKLLQNIINTIIHAWKKSKKKLTPSGLNTKIFKLLEIFNFLKSFTWENFKWFNIILHIYLMLNQ